MSRFLLYRNLRLTVLWLASAAVTALAPLLVSTRMPTALRDAVHGESSSGSGSGSGSSNTTSSTTVGFIGCGTIASAIVTGLAASDQVVRGGITVSRRSEHRSSALRAKFPHLVRVSDSNQAVLDAAEIVFLTVLPEQTRDVVQELAFDPTRHALVSLVSTANLDDLRAYSQLPAGSVFKMICLPAVAYNEGVCLLQRATSPCCSNVDGDDGVGDDEDVENPALPQQQQQQPAHETTLYNLLDTLGGVVMAESDEQMAAMMVPSGLIGSFYGVLRNNRDWLVKNAASGGGGGGMTRDRATYVVARYYHGMMQDAARRCGAREEGASAALERLIAEQTPGGLNEQGLAHLTRLGALESYDQVQDAILRRITGQSDGSLA